MKKTAVEGPFHHDLCLSFFGQCYSAGMFEFPPGARVLEVGCAEADWSQPMKTMRPDLHITSMDWRKCGRPGSDVVIQGDVLLDLFPPQSFDCLVSVSTIEHVGLGAYGDPGDPDGDTKAMRNLRRWIKPTGWLYFDVPVGDAYIEHKGYRRYDEAHLQTRLLEGWDERSRLRIDVDHPDSPYLAMTVTPA